MALVPLLTSDGSPIYTADGAQVMVDVPGEPVGCLVPLPEVPAPQEAE